ncbi:hypothetical protein H4Q26_011271 [Puccinia striiformis f. sp. tritici PST-130]|nr:hypothetical protein H4Q26_011271 [Puccinia striiformis f. sp. tritici PST-130]
MLHDTSHMDFFPLDPQEIAERMILFLHGSARTIYGRAKLELSVDVFPAQPSFRVHRQFLVVRSITIYLLLSIVSIVSINIFNQLIVPQKCDHSTRRLPHIPDHRLSNLIRNRSIRFPRIMQKEYGNVFTFILINKKVTVALGLQGNALVLNGKLAQVNAEEAYTALTTPVFDDRLYRGSYIPEPKNQQAVKDALKVASEITICTASATLQGPEVREGLNTSFADIYHDLDGGFTPLHFALPGLPLPSYRREI